LGFSSVNPDFNTYNASARILGTSTSKINVGPNSLERDASTFYGFKPTHLTAINAAGQTYSHSFNVAIGNYFFNRLLHDTTKRKTFLKLFDNHMTDNASVAFR